MLRKLMVVLGFLSLAAAGLGAAALASTSRSGACTPATPCVTGKAATTGSSGTGSAPATTSATTTASGGTVSTHTTTSATTTTGKAGPAPLFSSSSTAVEFGGDLKLSGRVPGASAGQTVEILAQSCGFTNPVVVANVKTGSAGAYAFTLQPTRNTTFLARFASATSSGRKVKVRPKVELVRRGSRLFQVDISAGAGVFFTKTVLLQRRDALHHGWRRTAAGKLRKNSSATALIAVSSAKIHAHVPAGTTVRAVVGAKTLGRCFAASASAPIGG
ncbi:MAG: hypothetical protein ACRDL2_13000 [Gaiellaceae bacterium]